MNRHILYFLALGLFWGLSPSQYRYWGEAGVPVSHVIVYTGFGLAVFLGLLARLRHGRLGWNRQVMTYSLVCALLMNVPFSFSLFFARHVPTPELALVFSLSPLINFVVGAVTGKEPLTSRRVFAIALGFVACAILVISRGGVTGEVTWWLLASFVNPFLYAGYNLYANARWPRGGTTFSIGAAESFWSGVLALPFMLVLARPWEVHYASQFAYASIAAATVMWVIERVSFFTLIREKGATYTAQAVYLSAPMAVVFAMFFFGGSSDIWLWISLAIVMAALWLNNSASATRPSS
jgi:drug/metabolite transporter (DMT)-like permease